MRDNTDCNPLTGDFLEVFLADGDLAENVRTSLKLRKNPEFYTYNNNIILI